MLSKILFATRDVDIRNIDEIDFITIVLYLIIATIVVVLLLSLLAAKRASLDKTSHDEKNINDSNKH